MSEPTSTPPAPAALAESFDPQRRRLCADDSCVGLVGPDGRCRVCGLAHPDGPGEGAALSPAVLHVDVDSDLDDTDEIGADDAGGNGLGAAAGDESGFSPGRALCPDGSCVGVLGADGRCKVCGRRGDAPAGGTGA